MHPIKRGYFSYLPPEQWEEGMLCGNGAIGAIVMGQPLEETIILSHEKLFIPWREKLPPVDSASHLVEIRRLLDAGQFREAAQRVVDLGQQAGYGEKRWTDPFFPACDLRIVTESQEKPRYYACGLDYASGLSTTEWRDGDVPEEARRRVFVSRADGIMALRFDAPAGGQLTCEMEIRQHPMDAEDDYWAGSEKLREGLGAPCAWAALEGGEGRLYYQGAFRHDGFRDAYPGYLCAARVVTEGGTISLEADRLRVADAHALTLLLDLRPVEAGKMPPVEEMTAWLAVLDADFEALLARHAAIHGALFERTELRMGFEGDWRIPAEEAWAAARRNGPSPAYFRRIFDAGRYEILASSGEWPPNLQGIWAGSFGVPWSSDYTQNGNVQTAVAGLLDGNLPECMDSYLRYLEYLLPESQENARRMYGCRGTLLASRTSSHGLNNHFDVTWPMTFWTAGAGWGAHFFYDTWLHTCDDNFFRRRALIYLKETADFYEDFLVEDENGYWRFTPSYSPENHPANSDSQATINATMDIAVARELFNSLIEGCRTLGIEEENIPRWEWMLSKMPPYRVNADGAAAEWCDPRLDDRYDHRHASHLFPLYYGVARELRSDPELLRAFQKAYAYRVAERNLEANVMAFGSVQLGQAAAHLGDTATLWRLLCDLASGYYYRSFATSHDRGPSIFNADLSGGMPALIQFALMQSEAVRDPTGRIASYRIHLLPALPPAWPDGEIRGLLARGGFVVNIEWQDGTLRKAFLRNPRNKKCRVLYRGVERTLEDFDAVTLEGDALQMRKTM